MNCISAIRNNILTFPLLLLCFRYCSVFKVQIFIAHGDKWWAWEDLNLRPHAYQACALTTWATSPCQFRRRSFWFSSIRRPWWRWGGSNSWPPACKAGALPAELHPRVYINRRYSDFCSLISVFKGTQFKIAPSKLNNDTCFCDPSLT